MKIEVWSDIVCPFCYIGKRNMEEAIKDFPQKDQVKVEMKSYQLDPETPLYNGQDFYESMAAKFGSVEKSKQMMANVTEQAKAAGLDFHFDTMKPTNTLDAHRLVKFAKEHDKEAALYERLLYAYFTESKDVGDVEALAEMAEEVGLNKDEARTILQDKQAYVKEVKADIAEAQEFGISGVPYFIFNRKYAISGAQPKEAFTQALEKVWKEEKPATTFQSLTPDNESDAACGDDGCAVPHTKES